MQPFLSSPVRSDPIDSVRSLPRPLSANEVGMTPSNSVVCDPVPN